MLSSKIKTHWDYKDGVLFEERINCVEEEDANFYYNYFNQLNLLEHGSSWLTIGGGAGALELYLAKLKQMNIGYLDPSKNLLDKFLKCAEDQDLSNSIIECHGESFQTARIEHKYDTIVAIHSWYYIGLSTQYFDKVLSCLKKGGKLIIILIHSDSFLPKCIKNFRNNHKDHSLLYSEKFSQWADSIGYNHEHVVGTHVVPKSRYLDSNNILTKTGENFVSYTARVNFEELSAETRTKVTNFLLENTHNNHFEFKFGMLLFKK